MNQNGSPEPIFQTDEDRNYFLTILKMHPAVKNLYKAKNRSKLGEKLGEKLTKTQLEIVKLIKINNSITFIELAKKLNTSEVTIYKNINKLKKMNIIKRIGSNRSGYWEVMENT